MNDYGEIISLPYKIEEIYEPLKKLLKYEKIKHMYLQDFDDENKILNVISKPFLRKLKITIKLNEIKNGLTEINIYSESNVPIDFNANRRVVRKLVNVIFKELEECSKTDNGDISVSIIKKKNRFKSIFNFITVAFLAFLVLYCIISAIDSVASLRSGNENNEALIAAAIFFGIVYAIIYKIVRLIKRKRYSRKRITNIKRMLYHLIEEKDVKKKVSSNFETNDIIKKIGVIPDKTKLYIDKGISYIKKTKEEKPKVFWTFTILIGIIVTWIIIGPIFGPKTLEGEYIQQMGRLSSKYGSNWGLSIKFSDGKSAMIAEGESYNNKTWFEYKIKGNKIYVIQNGEEVYTEFTIKNNNTLIYGDGVIDERCETIGAVLCGPNEDGIYIKK